MKYFVAVIDDRPESGTPEELGAIDAFNAQLVADGHWVFAAGLAGPAAATVVDNRRGDALVTDGPFAETKEFVSGFWVMEAPDYATILRLAQGASKACNRRLEVRPFLERRDV